MVAIVSIPTVYLRHSKNDQPQFVFEEVLFGENIKRTRVSNCQAKRQRLLRNRMVPYSSVSAVALSVNQALGHASGDTDSPFYHQTLKGLCRIDQELT